MLSFPARALCSLVDSRNLMRALHIKLSLQDNNAKRAQRSKQKWQPETNFFCAKLFLCPFNCLFGVLYEKLNSCNWGWFILYTVDHTNCSKLPKLASFSQNKLTKKRKPLQALAAESPSHPTYIGLPELSLAGNNCRVEMLSRVTLWRSWVPDFVFHKFTWMFENMIEDGVLKVASYT